MTKTLSPRCGIGPELRRPDSLMKPINRWPRFTCGNLTLKLVVSAAADAFPQLLKESYLLAHFMAEPMALAEQRDMV